MNVKKQARPGNISMLVYKSTILHLPAGANRNWSNDTRFSAGSQVDVLLIGNVDDRNLNHLCWRGDMMKPYDMKRTVRSKSNGGGSRLESGIMSLSFNGFLLSSS